MMERIGKGERKINISVIVDTDLVKDLGYPKLRGDVVNKLGRLVFDDFFE